MFGAHPITLRVAISGSPARENPLWGAVSWQPPAVVPLGSLSVLKPRAWAPTCWQSMARVQGPGHFCPMWDSATVSLFFRAPFGLAGTHRGAAHSEATLPFPCAFAGVRPPLCSEAFHACFCSLSPLGFMGVTPNSSLLLLTPPWHLMIAWPGLTHYSPWASVSRWINDVARIHSLIQSGETINDCYIVTSNKIVNISRLLGLYEDIDRNVCGRDTCRLWNIQVITHISSPGGVIWHVPANVL